MKDVGQLKALTSGVGGIKTRIPWRPTVSLLVLCLLQMGMRSLPVRDLIFPDSGRVRLLDTDSYYHLRIARHAMHHFPRLDRADLLDNFPREIRSDAAGLFDLTLAGTALLLNGGDPDDAVLERVCAWMPVFLGAVAVLCLHALARLWHSPGLALWTCAAFVMYPGESLERSVLGDADHHIAEIVLSLGTVMGLCHLLQQRQIDSWRRYLCAALVSATPLVLFVFTWTGGALYIAIILGGLWPMLTLEIFHGLDPRASSIAALAFGGVVLVGVGAVSLGMPTAVLTYVSLYPGLCGAGILAVGPALYLHAARAFLRRGLSPARVALIALLLSSVPVVAVLAGTAKGRWLCCALLNAKTSLVQENNEVTAASCLSSLGPPWVLALLALPLCVHRAIRSPEALSAVVPATCGVLLGLLWYRSHDYGYQVPALSALLAGLALACLEPVAHKAGFRAHPAIIPTLLVTLLVPPLFSRWFRLPWATPAMVQDLIEIDEGWEQTAEWLRHNTPEPVPLTITSAHKAPRRGMDYGIAASWERGNIITALASRPTVWSRYPSIRAGEWWLTSDEEESLALLCPDCSPAQRVRYMVVDARGVAQKYLSWVLLARRSLESYRKAGGFVNIQGRRLEPATYGASYDSAISVRLYYNTGNGLSHYRLVYESPRRCRHFYLHDGVNLLRMAVPLGTPDGIQPFEPARPPLEAAVTPNGIEYDVSTHPEVKVFEVVPGALLEAPAPPGTIGELRLPLEVRSTGRRFVYSKLAQADARGRLRWIVPYSTDRVSRGTEVRPLDLYRLRLTARAAKGHTVARRVAVSEAQIRSGETVSIAFSTASAGESEH